jgi:hypothetical protein
MRYLKNIKLFESYNYNISFLKDIINCSYVIEEEGYKIVYFVTIESGSEKDKGYTYAIGSSYDINNKIYSIRDNKIIRVFLEIVNDIPRTIGHEKLIKEMEIKDNLFDYILNSYKLLLPDYEVNRSYSGPPYIFIHPKYSSKNESLSDRYGSDLINKIDTDISHIKDILIELEDMGFFVSVNYTPFTIASANPNIDYNEIEIPQFYIDIKKPENWIQFYDETYPTFNKSKELINSIISHVLYYMEEKNYKIVENSIPSNIGVKYNPTDFQFKNNPTSYQITFTR